MGARIEDCSCPRGGGWRPGARWARREEVEGSIEMLPLHQRPAIRELGRRSEAAQVPFRGNERADPRSSRAKSRGVAEIEERASTSLGTNGHSNEPCVTVHRSGQRVTLASCCPAARALGLHAGMVLTHARALVPGLDVRDAEPERDAILLARLGLFAARRWTPRAAVSGPDGLWLDLGGAAHLFGGERAMCRRILGFCARLGLSARIAVAGNLGAAHALARFGGDRLLLCPEGGEAAALSPLPIAALRIDAESEAAARRLGIERIGDLAAMPRAPLGRRFGQAFLLRLDQALGGVAETFDPILPADAPETLLRFAEPIATAEAIGQVIEDLLDRLIATLEESGLAARLVTLICSRVDGEEQSLTIGTARATRNRDHLLRLLAMRIEAIEPGFGIESMRLVAGRTEPLGPQPVEGELGGEPLEPDLVPLIDRLAGRLGARRLYRFSAIESDVPERSVARVSPLAAAKGWPRWPRPVRLLVPPERVENVVALLPDQPPRRFTWRGRVHAVRRADGPERIFGEWWARPRETEAVRDYFEVEDEEGARFWLYRRGDGVDKRTGDLGWYMHGLFG